jgi:hypothetical protein
MWSALNAQALLNGESHTCRNTPGSIITLSLTCFPTRCATCHSSVSCCCITEKCKVKGNTTHLVVKNRSGQKSFEKVSLKLQLKQQVRSIKNSDTKVLHRFWKTASLLDTQQNWMHYILTERTSDNIGAHSEASLWNIWTHLSQQTSMSVLCALSYTVAATFKSVPLTPLASSMLPTTKCCIVCGDIWNEIMSFDPFPGKAEIECQSNFQILLALYSWRHTLLIHLVKMC